MSFIAAFVLSGSAHAMSVVELRTVAIVEDTRKCAAPLCGGWYYWDVNTALTTCIDGSEQPVCYAAELDFFYVDVTDRQVDLIVDRAKNGLVTLDVASFAVPSPWGTLESLAVFGGQRVQSPVEPRI